MRTDSPCALTPAFGAQAGGRRLAGGLKINLMTSPDDPQPFSLRGIAVAAFGPTLLYGIGTGAILPVVALTARDLGASVAVPP